MGHVGVCLGIWGGGVHNRQGKQSIGTAHREGPATNSPAGSTLLYGLSLYGLSLYGLSSRLSDTALHLQQSCMLVHLSEPANTHLIFIHNIQ